ncbi:MAG: hypothetical protein AB7Y46_14220 [Armatimonadota bacterium]
MLTLSRFDQDTRPALQALGAASLQIEDCSLEDIFVAHVRPAPVAGEVAP